MTRTCWSIVVLSLVVVMAASFEVVWAKDKDKDSKQPSGGGQPANNVQPRQGGSRPGGGSDTKQPGFNNSPRTNQQGDSNRGSSNVPRSGNVQGSQSQQFQTNKPNVNNQGGKGSAGGGNPDRGKGNPPNNPQFNPPNQFNQPKTGGSNVQPNNRGGNPNPQNRSPQGTIPPQGNSTGTNKGTGQRFDSGRSGPGTITNQNNVGSNQNKTGQVINRPADTVGVRNKGTSGKPKISIEPDSAKSTAGNRLGTPNFNPQRDPNGKPNPDSRLDPKGTIKIDNPSDVAGRSGRVKPQSISKNGVLSTIPPKNPGLSKNDKPVDLADNEKRGAGIQDDDVVRGLFSPGRNRKPGKGDAASLLPLGTDNDGKKPDGLNLPLGKDDNRKPRTELTQFAERDDLHRQLKKVKESPELQNKLGLQNLNLDRISGVHQDRLARAENFEHWQRSKYGTKLGLQRQFELQRQGDLSRRMNLSQNLVLAGGWTQHRQHGIVAAGFTTGAFSVWYAGGGCYPTHCWCPTWSPWVNWCWWDTCPIFYDPRPYYCIPVVYDPCPPWVFYQYPVWTPLPVVACGTWIDVSPVVVTAGQDVQLLAVRFVDNGHPENNQGPRYRVWVRNNSPIQVTSPFSVLLMASNQQTPTIETPQAGVVIPSMDIGETQVVDVRLPLSANRLGTTPEGYKVPFTYLHTLVDSHQQINETFEENNGSVVARTDILPVDPAAFSTDLTAAAPEDVLTVAGEGFGPEPGQIVVSVYGQQVQAEIQGWYDLGVRFTVPNFELSQPVDAEVLVVRGDSAVSNPISVRLAPETLLDDDSNAVRLPLPPAPQ